MTLYYNLSPEQRRVQQLVAPFNADEQPWRSLKSKRRCPRHMRPHTSSKLRRQLDLLEFANSRPIEDRVGQFSET